jgi:hypothetical protein
MKLVVAELRRNGGPRISRCKMRLCSFAFFGLCAVDPETPGFKTDFGPQKQKCGVLSVESRFVLSCTEQAAEAQRVR